MQTIARQALMCSSHCRVPFCLDVTTVDMEGDIIDVNATGIDVNATNVDVNATNVDVNVAIDVVIRTISVVPGTSTTPFV